MKARLSCFRPIRLGWFAIGGSLAVIAVAATVLLYRQDDRAPSAADNVAATSQTLPSAEEILERSKEAMAALPFFRVEVMTSLPLTELPMTVPVLGVFEYDGTRLRVIYSSLFHITDCSVELAQLHESGWRVAAPQTLELLGDQTIDGHAAWLIRYTTPSSPNVAAIEYEWIAKDGFMLLRQENRTTDDTGNERVVVSIFRGEHAQAAECPSAPEHDADDFVPRTAPRTTSPTP